MNEQGSRCAGHAFRRSRQPHGLIDFGREIVHDRKRERGFRLAGLDYHIIRDVRKLGLVITHFDPEIPIQHMIQLDLPERGEGVPFRHFRGGDLEGQYRKVLVHQGYCLSVFGVIVRPESDLNLLIALVSAVLGNIQIEYLFRLAGGKGQGFRRGDKSSGIVQNNACIQRFDRGTGPFRDHTDTPASFRYAVGNVFDGKRVFEMISCFRNGGIVVRPRGVFIICRDNDLEERVFKSELVIPGYSHRLDFRLSAFRLIDQIAASQERFSFRIISIHDVEHLSDRPGLDIAVVGQGPLERNRLSDVEGLRHNEIGNRIGDHRRKDIGHFVCSNIGHIAPVIDAAEEYGPVFGNRDRIRVRLPGLAVKTVFPDDDFIAEFGCYQDFILCRMRDVGCRDRSRRRDPFKEVELEVFAPFKRVARIVGNSVGNMDLVVTEKSLFRHSELDCQGTDCTEGCRDNLRPVGGDQQDVPADGSGVDRLGKRYSEPVQSTANFSVGEHSGHAGRSEVRTKIHDLSDSAAGVFFVGRRQSRSADIKDRISKGKPETAFGCDRIETDREIFSFDTGISNPDCFARGGNERDFFRGNSVRINFMRKCKRYAPDASSDCVVVQVVSGNTEERGRIGRQHGIDHDGRRIRAKPRIDLVNTVRSPVVSGQVDCPPAGKAESHPGKIAVADAYIGFGIDHKRCFAFGHGHVQKRGPGYRNGSAVFKNGVGEIGRAAAVDLQTAVVYGCRMGGSSVEHLYRAGTEYGRVARDASAVNTDCAAIQYGFIRYGPGMDRGALAVVEHHAAEGIGLESAGSIFADFHPAAVFDDPRKLAAILNFQSSAGIDGCSRRGKIIANTEITVVVDDRVPNCGAGGYYQTGPRIDRCAVCRGARGNDKISALEQLHLFRVCPAAKEKIA